MRFFADDLSVEIPVEWYYVPEDRPVVPYAHPFVSSDGDEPGIPRLLGEVPGTRSYYAGNHENDLLGQGLCGSKEQWENGPSLLDACLPTNPTTGRQCCCGKGQLPMEAGLVMGAELETEFPPQTDQCLDWNPSPEVFRFLFLGANCPGSAIFPAGIPDANYGVQWTIACRWFNGSGVNTFFGTANWRLAWNFGPWGAGWRLRLAQTAGGTPWLEYHHDGTNWSNFGPNEMALVTNNTDCLAVPATVSIRGEFS